MIPVDGQDALHMIKKGRAHRSRIASFDKADWHTIYDTLDRWLRAKVYPLKSKS